MKEKNAINPSQIFIRLIPAAVGVILGIFFKWCFIIPLTLRATSFWRLIIICTLIAFGIEFAIDKGNEEYHNSRLQNYGGSFIYGGIAAIILIAFIGCSCFGTQVFNAEQYRQAIEVTESNFNEDIPNVEDTSKVAVVDLATAEKLGDRTVGGIKNATWYDVDNEYNLIIKNGNYYRISPLNYGSFSKYCKAKHFGIPGYVLVNAKTQEATYVELEEAMTISPSASFGNKLERVLRKQYPTFQFGTSYFEVDEQGNPYWITSVQTPSMGVWKAKLVTAVIITDAVTGECKLYEVKDVPNWVDHIYPLDHIMTLVDYHYKYVHGYMNTLWGKKDLYETTYCSYRSDKFAGYNSAITSDGEVVFYTGITPANDAETNLGFILASPRTGVVKYYDCAGAEESSAQAAAQGLVQNLGYVATFPTVLNVDGVETYFMALKDGAGLVQRYALCQVSNYVNVVEAITLDEALTKYKQKLGMTEEETAPVVETSTVSGTVTSIYTAEVEGFTYYYFTLDDGASLYMSSIVNNYRQVAMTVGDKVEVTYTHGAQQGIEMVSAILIK